LAMFSLWPSWVLTTRPGWCASGLIICQIQIQGYIQSWQLRPEEGITPAVTSQFISITMQIWPCWKSVFYPQWNIKNLQDLCNGVQHLH
jgi:hypothetical protein